MAFTTKIIHDSSPDMGDSPVEITEQGRPASVGLQGLTPNTVRYVRAELYEDGAKVDSDETSFQTLPAGSMTVTYGQYRRASCHEHCVTYTYTSTYAPSSAILHVTAAGGFAADYQGAIDSGNHSIVFDCDDWDGGVVYTCTATLTDIYGESQTSAVTTLTSGTINAISCAVSGVPTQTSVTLSIEKCLDGGFYNGYAEWWLGTDDPGTDLPQGHSYFQETDGTVTVDNLTAGTEYIFRVSATLDDMQTVVGSAYVHATTAAGWNSRELTFVPRENAGSYDTMELRIHSYYRDVWGGTPPSAFTIETSEDGSTWTSRTLTPSWYTANSGKECDTLVCQVTAGSPLMVRSSDVFGYTYGTTAQGNYTILRTTFTFKTYQSSPHPYDVQGNLYSLGYKTTFKTQDVTPRAGQYANMFAYETGLVSAANLDMTHTTAGDVKTFSHMFSGCTNLTAAPAIPGNIGEECCASMFSGCTSLTAAADVSGVSSVGKNGMKEMFRGCTSLASAPSLAALRTIGQYGLDSMFRGCTSLAAGADLSAVTSVGDGGCNYMYSGSGVTLPGRLPASVTTLYAYEYAHMYEGCASLTTAPDTSHITALESRHPGQSVAGGSMNSMFKNCTSLASPPDLTGLTTVGYYALKSAMEGCASLTKPADIRGATAEDTRAFDSLYKGCSNLPEAYAPQCVNGWTGSSNSSADWLDGVAAGGTVHAPDATVKAAIPLDSASGCPSGWTVQVSPL